MKPRAPLAPLDLSRLRVLPLSQRHSLTRCEDILLSPDAPAPALPESVLAQISAAAAAVEAAHKRGASVMLIYGAHLLRNGAALILDALMQSGWLTHVATNGAGTIHDWEYAWLGRSTEGVQSNVATGTFGCWEETGSSLHLALMAGALEGLGWGRALGRFIAEDGVTLPPPEELEHLILERPDAPRTGALADLLGAMRRNGWSAGRRVTPHPWKQASILASAWRHGVAATVHPGIGYDIISNHPSFNGAVLGRGADLDFRLFGGSVAGLDGGVVLSVGSAVMGPQVFEKSLSCVNNLRLQEGLPAVAGHSIFVVDLQDGGGWDWTVGEPPKDNPAYYLRFCKSFSRMGAPMHYLQCDNAAFIQHLWRTLAQKPPVA
jgi:hypothetical protein